MDRPTTDQDWEPFKDQIKSWYVDEGRSKTQVVALLKDRGFIISYSQLQYRLRDWGFQRFTRKRPGLFSYGGVIPPCGHDAVSQAGNTLSFEGAEEGSYHTSVLHPTLLTPHEQQLLMNYSRHGQPYPPAAGPMPLQPRHPQHDNPHPSNGSPQHSGPSYPGSPHHPGPSYPGSSHQSGPSYPASPNHPTSPPHMPTSHQLDQQRRQNHQGHQGHHGTQ